MIQCSFCSGRIKLGEIFINRKEKILCIEHSKHIEETDKRCMLINCEGKTIIINEHWRFILGDGSVVSFCKGDNNLTVWDSLDELEFYRGQNE